MKIDQGYVALFCLRNNTFYVVAGAEGDNDYVDVIYLLNESLRIEAGVCCIYPKRMFYLFLMLIAKQNR